MLDTVKIHSPSPGITPRTVRANEVTDRVDPVSQIPSKTESSATPRVEPIPANGEI
jgi:hypothetical protein